MKTIKARKYSSSKIKELLDEVSPIEMEKTKNKMLLATRIEEMMNERGWNKTRFAKEVNKNASEITKWFSGTQNLTVETLTEIASAFGVEVATLLGKPQIQVIYRTKYIAHSVVRHTPIVISTPISEYDYVEGVGRNYFGASMSGIASISGFIALSSLHQTKQYG